MYKTISPLFSFVMIQGSNLGFFLDFDTLGHFVETKLKCMITLRDNWLG